MSELREGILAEGEDEIILECQERFNSSQEAESKNRTEFEFDKRFVDGEQWDPVIKDERFSDRRPALTVNLTDSITRRVINNCRENRPRLVCHPVGSKADIDTAKVIDGLFRHIEYSSTANYWYDNAIENSVQGGWGWLAIDNEYASEDSFDQELRIKGYSNPLMCYADPNSRMPDGSDMEYFIESEMMNRVVYKQRFGRIDEQGWRYVGKGDDFPDWSNKEEIRVAKYWRVEHTKDTLIEFTDGQRILKSEMGLKRNFQKLTGGLTKLREREVLKRQVKCYLLTATKILKTTDWPGKWIPRVPVYGRRLDLNGRITVKGMVRDLRDPARIYNYAQTAKTEAYALSPKAPWVGAKGFMEGSEAAWRDSNRKPIVALEYSPVVREDGSYEPPPIRQPPVQPNAGFAEWGESTKSDFLAVAGMPHDPGQDMQGEVVSGKALKARQAMSDISNFDFYDNFCRSLNHVGRIIVDLLPHFYGEERMIRIIREDGTPSQVTINQVNTQQPQVPMQPMSMAGTPMPTSPMEKAVKHIKNDLTVGEYEVVIDTGPDYQTKREQSAESMLHLLTTPLGEMVAQNAGDVMIRNMDFPSADMVADRLTAMIPAAQNDKELENLPQEARGIVAGLQQRVSQLMQENMSIKMQLETKSNIVQMQEQAETGRTQMKEQGALEREHIKAGVKETDTNIRAHTAMHDTHVKAVTAHDVAEIHVAGQMMNSHLDNKNQREEAKRLLKDAKDEPI